MTSHSPLWISLSFREQGGNHVVVTYSRFLRYFISTTYRGSAGHWGLRRRALIGATGRLLSPHLHGVFELDPLLLLLGLN
jgi:hypothetical protein